MSVETLERSVLEGKDREQLLAIASALGVKALSRAKKADIIDRILEQTGAGPPADGTAPTNGSGNGNGRGSDRTVAETASPAARSALHDVRRGPPPSWRCSTSR